MSDRPAQLVRDAPDCQLNWEWAQKNVPGLVTALPSNPVDGQEVYFVAESTLGIIWHLRYRAASASAYKWEFVGGPPLNKDVGADETIAAATITYVALATAITVSVPLAGDYLIDMGARGYPWGVAQDLYIAADGCGLTAVDADAVFINCANGLGNIGSRSILKTLTTGTLAAKYRHSNNTATANFSNRFLRALPVRVG